MSRKTKTTAVISLILVFAFMFVAAGFNNDWGRVHISDVYYPNSEGGMIHAQLFVPENASSANPLPAILNMHGGSDYLQTVSNYSLELARAAMWCCPWMPTAAVRLTILTGKRP